MDGPRYRGLDALAWRLLVAGLCMHLCVSRHLLLLLGFPYESPLAGPFPFKVHPGTYLTVLSLLCSLASRGNPLRTMGVAARREPALTLGLAVMVACLAWVVLRHGTSGAAFIIDTHWLPALAAFAQLHMDDRRRAFLLKLIAVVMAVNAALALGEHALQQRLIPLYLQGPNGGYFVDTHFRSSALLGHPLENATLTAALLPIGLLMPWPPLWRWLHLLLLLLSMLAFGGRAGLAAALALYGAWGLWRMAESLLRGRFSYLQLTGGSVVLVVVLAALAGVVALTGLGDRIFATLYLDNSAGVRLRVWQAYEYVGAEGLWLGLSAREIDALALQLGLDPDFEAIENGWIYLSLLLGLPVFGLWLAGFAVMSARLLREAPPVVRVALLTFLVSASTSNFLGAKSVGVGLMATYALAAGAMVRRTAAAAPTPRAQAGAPGDRRSVRDGGSGPGAPAAPRPDPGAARGRPGLPALPVEPIPHR